MSKPKPSGGMKKYKCFLFNADDWLSSLAVEEMSGDEVKAYVYLLCRAWNNQPTLTLPNDDTRLARMARVSPDQWEKIKPAVLANFQSNGNGLLFNPRIRKAQAYAVVKRKAGESGWDDARRRKAAVSGKSGGRPKVRSDVREKPSRTRSTNPSK